MPIRRWHLFLVLCLGFGGVCWVAAAPADQERFSSTLHRSHQGDGFRTALTTLREGGKGVDECAVCHGSRSWWETLIQERPPVRREACQGCHQPGTALGKAFGKPEEPGRPERPAHQRMDPTPRDPPGGMPSSVFQGKSLATPLGCGQCHTDHLGANFKAAKFENGFCGSCHVPTQAGERPLQVLKRMADLHREKAFMEIKENTAEAIWAGMGDQECSGCHSEHTPNPDNDKKPAGTPASP